MKPLIVSGLLLFVGITHGFAPPVIQSVERGLPLLMAVPPMMDHHSVNSITTLISDISAPPEAGGISYSKASYYTILGLYAMSFPGLLSTVKRSTAAKVKRKTYVSPGENAKDGLGLRQQAGEIMACTC